LWLPGRNIEVADLMGLSPGAPPMFHALTASGPRPTAGAYRYVLSVGFHGALVAGAVALTRHPSAATRPRPPEPAILVVAPQPARTSLPSHEIPGQTMPSPPLWQPNIGAPDLSPSVLSPTMPTVVELLQAFSLGEATPVDTGLLTAAAVDDAVAIVEQPAPRYPIALAQAGITGRVELTYVVDTAGRAEPGTLCTLMSTHPAFEGAAYASVLASRYKPARWRGRVVRQLVRQTLSFRLEE
jgi:TonB family protein